MAARLAAFVGFPGRRGQSRAPAQFVWLSFGLLSVLAAGVVLIVTNAQRSERLATQQMDFVTTVSHELRTPLAVIRSAAQNLSAGVIDDPARAKQYGELIEAEGRRLTEMVEQVCSTHAGIDRRRLLVRRPRDWSTSGRSRPTCSPRVGHWPRWRTSTWSPTFRRRCLRCSVTSRPSEARSRTWSRMPSSTAPTAIGCASRFGRRRRAAERTSRCRSATADSESMRPIGPLSSTRSSGGGARSTHRYAATAWG